MMSAPARARDPAMARPMPWLAPVTTASFPSRLSRLSAYWAGVVGFVIRWYSLSVVLMRPGAGVSRAWLRSCWEGGRVSGLVTKGDGDLVGELDGQPRHGL